MALLTNVIEDIAELALPMDIVRISKVDFKRLEQQKIILISIYNNSID
ncbi:hypothetical protein [Aerococcus urinaeequi]